MNFVNPGGLWFALLTIPIVIFYLLRIRRKEVEVSSTMLWRKALQDRQANAPWQKLRRNLLLLLQLLILAAMVLAAARLAFPVAAISSGTVVLLLDGSASMQAEDVAPDRFAAAVDAAAELVRQTGEAASISAILVTHQPRILFGPEAERPEALAALEEAAPAQGEADWEAAFSLAASLALSTRTPEDLSFVILSDGGLPEDDLPVLPGRTRYIPIGTSSDNLAVSALSVRTRPAGDAAELFASVTNYGDSERAAALVFEQAGEVLRVERLSLPPGGQASVVLDNLPAQDAVYTARLENIQADLPLDDFPLDDHADAVLVPPPRRSVLLVSPGNLFLERLLLLLPNLDAARTSPGPDGELTMPARDFDMYVLDGVLPAEGLPEGSLLMVNPPTNDLFPVTGTTAAIENPHTTDHPLAQFLDWDGVNVAETRQIPLPEWAAAVVDSDTTPLVFVGETGGRRVAVVGFDLHQTDLPLQVAFPILFANLFDYLVPRGMVANPEGLRPNEPVTLLPDSGAAALSVDLPDGEQVLVEDPGAEVVFSQTGQPGVYTVRAGSGANVRESAFAVNLFSPAESDIRPAEAVQIGRSAISGAGKDELNDREVWPWLIFLALAVLLLEWLAYHRRLG